MKMKNYLLTALVSLLPSLASAEWVLGVAYSNLGADDVDVNLGVVSGSVGYRSQATNGLFIVPRIRIGTGISDDSDSGVDVELDRFFALSVRGEYELVDQVYAFIEPSYANVEATAKRNFLGSTITVNDDEWEFGIGGGIGFRFLPELDGEVSFESFDGDNLISLGARYRF